MKKLAITSCSQEFANYINYFLFLKFQVRVECKFTSESYEEHEIVLGKAEWPALTAEQLEFVQVLVKTAKNLLK